jgi:hypothetical protein
MNDIILRNRNLGPEVAMQLAEERAPNGFARVEDVISQDELDVIVKSFAAAAGLDVETVNHRPSYLSPSARRFYGWNWGEAAVHANGAWPRTDKEAASPQPAAIRIA